MAAPRGEAAPSPTRPCEIRPPIRRTWGGVGRLLVGFDWDTGNLRKSELEHGVAATEALLSDLLCQVDERHSGVERRYVALGTTNEGRCLFVAFTVRNNRVRIISARPMSRKERAIHDPAKSRD